MKSRQTARIEKDSESDRLQNARESLIIEAHRLTNIHENGLISYSSYSEQYDRLAELNRSYEKRISEQRKAQRKKRQPAVVITSVMIVIALIGLLSIFGKDLITGLASYEVPEIAEENITVPSENITMPEENIAIPEENITLPEGILTEQEGIGYGLAAEYGISQATPWFDNSWEYRKQINVSNSYDNLTEYQILLYLDTAELIDAGKMNSDCSDIRIANSTGGLVPYYLDENPGFDCNDTDTLIWIQTDVLASNANNTFYVYYGNSEASSLSDITEVFNYTQLKAIYYTVGENVYDGSISVVAYRDNTNVTATGKSVILSAGATTSFTTAQYGGTGASYLNVSSPIIGGDNLTSVGAEINPISWASKEFVIANGRGAFDIYFYSPFEAITINCYEATTTAGTWGASQDSASCSKGAACAATTKAWTSGYSIYCNSTAPFLMYVESGANANFPVYPISNDVWAISDSVTANARTGAYIQQLNSSGGNKSGTQNIAYRIAVGDGADGSGLAWHIFADQAAIHSSETADGDGSEDAAYRPEFELEKEYYLYKDGDYVAIAATRVNTNCTLYTNGGYANLSDMSSGSNDYPYPSKVDIGTGADTQRYIAGARVICNATWGGHWELTGDDESTLYGMKSGRQYVYPEPTYIIGSEEMPTVYSVNITTNATSATTIINVNATYLITITNNGTNEASTYNLTYNNVNNADTIGLNQTNITLASGASDNVTFRITDADPGEYNATVTALLSTNASINATTAVMITTVQDNEAPVVRLVSPANNSWNTSKSINFTANATDNYRFANCSIYTNETSWTLKQVNTSAVTNNTKFMINNTFAADGIYLWNIYCCDTSGNCAFNSTNWTIKVDSAAPVISAAESNISTAIVNDYARVNCTAADAGIGIDKFAIEADKPTSTNQNYSTSQLSGDTWYADIQLTEAGAWSFSCWVNDTLGNLANMAGGSIDVSAAVASVNITTNATSMNTSVSVNATYLITIGNNGTAGTKTYNITYNNMNSADTIGANQSNISLAEGASGSILFMITDADAGQYNATVTALLSTNAGINATTAIMITNVTAAANQAPVITDISDIPAQSITEAGVSYVNFSVLASDENGADNLNDNSLNATFSKSGETTRFNSSCSWLSDINTTTANYTCTIGLWYWDGAGTWDVNATILDLSNAQSSAYKETFALSETTAMVMSPNSLGWATLFPGSVDKLSNNDPIIINNTGNKDIASGNVRVKAYDLIGETNPDYSIPAANFSVNVNDACEGTPMQNNTAVGITSSVLSAGNNSAGSGQEQLYFCMEEVPNIIQQAYSTALNWIIDII